MLNPTSFNEAFRQKRLCQFAATHQADVLARLLLEIANEGNRVASSPARRPACRIGLDRAGKDVSPHGGCFRLTAFAALHLRFFRF